MFEIGVENRPAAWLALLAGAALALALGALRARKAGIRNRKILLTAVGAPLLAAFGSHLGYCLADLSNVLYSHSLGYLFAFWQPGYMFYGGLLGALAAMAVLGGKERLALMDAFAPSLAVMVAAARIAEGFLGQGYGEYWYEEEIFFCRFPFMTWDPYYECWGWALFMAEALVAVCVLVVLLRKKNGQPGDGMLLFAGLYAAPQIVLESLRRDEFLRWGFVRVEEVLSGVAILLVLIAYCVRAGRGRWLQKTLCFVLFAAMVVFCLLLEFATEGRIPFLVFLDVWQCYALMAAASAVCAACVVWMRRMNLQRSEA